MKMCKRLAILLVMVLPITSCGVTATAVAVAILGGALTGAGSWEWKRR